LFWNGVEVAAEENEDALKIGGDLMKNGSDFGIEFRKRLGQLYKVSLRL